MIISRGSAIRIVSPGHAAFAVMVSILGAMGLVTGDFTQVWQPVPKWVPAQPVLAYLCALIFLGCGIGLVWRRSAPVASRLLFFSLMTWLLLLRLPNLFYQTPLVLVAWTFGSTAVMVAGAWVLYVWFAGADRRGIRLARILYGISLVPFGLAHFMYLDATTVLIPNWLPWHTGLAYLTGATFIAGGLAVATGILARPAALLSTLQLLLFGLIVWVPRVLAGNVNQFQRGEFIITFALAAGAWVVADSYRIEPGANS